MFIIWLQYTIKYLKYAFILRCKEVLKRYLIKYLNKKLKCIVSNSKAIQRILNIIGLYLLELSRGDIDMEVKK